MGFFSLANRAIQLTVQQKGTPNSWELTADPKSFKGEKEIECNKGPYGHRGINSLDRSANGTQPPPYS